MHRPWKTILRPLFAIVERELLFFLIGDDAFKVDAKVLQSVIFLNPATTSQGVGGGR